MGTTFEEQQEARRVYQDKVKAAKGKALSLNPTHETPNPAVDEGATVGERQDGRKDETTAEEIQASGEAMGAPEQEESDDPGADEDSSDDSHKKPSKSASKGEWVEYVAATTDLSEEEADEFTQKELVEKYG